MEQLIISNIFVWIISLFSMLYAGFAHKKIKSLDGRLAKSLTLLTEVDQEINKALEEIQKELNEDKE